MPQFQIITVGIVCAAIFTCWLVFSGSTFNVGLTPFIAGAFLIASSGLVFWVLFTPGGKAFAREYNKVQQKKAAAVFKIISIAEAVIKETNFQMLMNEFVRLYTFTEVAEWDIHAEQEIQKIINAIQTIETEINQYEPLIGKLQAENYRVKYKSILESMAEKLQEAIDFTPNSSKEQKALLKELRQQKKELQLQKREISATMRDIQKNARTRSAYAGRGFLGIYNSKLATSERRRIRYQKEAGLLPNEDIKAAIERQILQIDKEILSVERFSE